MTNQSPDPPIADPLDKFLEVIESEISATLNKMDSLKREDPAFGYARALGHATCTFHTIQTITQTARAIYFNA